MPQPMPTEPAPRAGAAADPGTGATSGATSGAMADGNDEAAPATETRHQRGRHPGKAHHVPWSVLAVIALGGALGALARWGIQSAWPAADGNGFPYPTLIANTVGGLLIGVLMVLVGDLWAGRRLVRPFLGVGVLGGFTTFSTYVVEIHQLVSAGAAGRAIGYLVGTIGAVLFATFLGAWSARRALRAGTRATANGARS